MLSQEIIKAYSNIHLPIEYTNGNEISFEGSQIQAEFFKAWNLIETYYKSNPTKELKFLEVGAWRGLWGIAFTEFCKLNNIKGSYLTLTLIDQDPNNLPLYNTLDYIKSQNIKADLININSLSDNALDEISKHSDSFDIVFIDAAHDYDSVINDIKKFAPLATDILLFHDIRPKAVLPGFGVYQAIIDSNLSIDVEIVTNENGMGIGIIYTKK